MRRLIALGAAAALLAGCTLDPAYKRPDAPVPPAFPQGPSYAPPQDGPAAASISWRAFFTDAKLKSVIEKALAENRDLRTALADIQAARAKYAVQRASLLPGVNGSFGETYERIPGAVEGVPGVASIDSRAYSLNAGFSAWEIDLFGHTRSLTRAALQQYLASEDNQRSVKTSLIAEVATDYFTLAADRQLLEVARRTLTSQQASLDLIQGRMNAGVASMVDVVQAQTTVQQARSDVAQYTTNSAQAKNALDLVVGASVPEFLLPQGLTAPAGEVADLAPGTSSQVLLRRPDVLEAEHQLKANNADIGAARASFFPSITLTAQAGQESTALSTLFKAGSGSWLFQPNVSLPLFAGGANVGNLRYAKAERDAAVAAYEKAIQTAFREVADALARKGTITEQLAAQQALVDANAENLTLSTARYDRGADTYLNVLVAERSLYSAQQTQISTQLSGLTNVVELYRALGGGQS